MIDPSAPFKFKQSCALAIYTEEIFVYMLQELNDGTRSREALKSKVLAKYEKIDDA